MAVSMATNGLSDSSVCVCGQVVGGLGVGPDVVWWYPWQPMG